MSSKNEGCAVCAQCKINDIEDRVHALSRALVALEPALNEMAGLLEKLHERQREPKQYELPFLSLIGAPLDD